MPRAAGSPESTIVWTDEEKRYLRRLLSHDFLAASSEIRRALTAKRMKGPPSNEAKKPVEPVGEFRILVLGAKGTGKTSLLTKICHNRLPVPSQTSAAPTPQNYRTTADVDSQPYAFDALELPSKHLWRDDLVQQAIAATDAALLVYSAADPPSLRLARGLAELISDTVAAASPAKDYAVLLVGNKSDVAAGERLVAYSEGSRAAGAFGIAAGFMEVSAATGDQVGLVLPRLGRDVLVLRGIAERRRENAAERARRGTEGEGKGGGGAEGKKAGLWKRIGRPFFSRREVAQN